MTMESVLLGIRTNMLEGGARIEHRLKMDYAEAEASSSSNIIISFIFAV